MTCKSFWPFIVALLLSGGDSRAANWPQWRGPSGDGVSPETGLPAKWSESNNVLWKLPLPGSGASTPAVWKDHIFLTSAEGNDIIVMAISTRGHVLWKAKLGTGNNRAYRRDEANQASPSLSTDGRYVYGMAGTGDLAAFDFDGKPIWHVDLQKRYGEFQTNWGMHMTPLLEGDRLYLSLLHTNAWLVIALEKSTGEEVWKVRRDSDAHRECAHSYASPALWRDGAKAYLIIHGCDYTTAHRLDDGAEIWRLGGLNAADHYDSSLRFVASPVATTDLIVVPTAKNGPVVALKPSATSTVGPGSEFEIWRQAHNTPDVPSPLVHNGIVYLCRETGVLIAIDAATGKEFYQQSLHKARYRASPVLADGRLYCVSRDGYVSVVKAGPKFELLAVNQLNDQFAASPAIADGCMYLRGFGDLYAVGKMLPGASK
jgi:outer membrane protein assembly factor BamB